MAGNVQTDLLLNAKTRGFEQATQKTSQLGKSSKQAMSESRREVERLEGSLRKLAQEQIKLTRALERTDRGSKAFKTLTQELRGVQREAAQTTKTIGTLERAYQSAGQRRGAFTQGLLQGAVPSAAFIQRGPGAMRQAAGVGVGAAIRGVAGGLASTPFSGASGLSQALQSLPGGGFAAMPLMQAMGQAQQALSFRQTQAAQMPFLGGLGMQAGVARARRRAARRFGDVEARARGLATERVMGMETSDLPIEEVMQANIERTAAERGIKLTRIGQRLSHGILEREAGGPEALRRKTEVRAAEIARLDALSDARRDVQRRKGQEAAQAGRAARRGFLGDITGTGAAFGFAAPEAAGIAGAISAAGGGTGREMNRQGLLQPAMAAQRFLGVGPQVAGAFLQGGRRGGLVGGMGRAGRAFEETLKEGLRMGLEGSELQEYMASMAADIRSWRNTGIPINAGSVAKMGQAIGQMGLGGLRGGVVARGVSARARELSTRGPQTAAEFAMFQELGGFKGGGAQAVEEAQLRLEEGGGLTGEAMQKLFSRFLGAGGGGAGGRAVFRRAMRGMGVNVGIRESRLLEKQVRGGTLTQEEQATMDRSERERMRGAAAAQAFQPGRLAQAVDPALRRQAEITNRQIRSGQVMIKVMQDLESSSTAIAQSFTTLAGKPLQSLTSGIEALSMELPQASERARAFLAGDMFGMFSGGGGT